MATSGTVHGFPKDLYVIKSDDVYLAEDDYMEFQDNEKVGVYQLVSVEKTRVSVGLERVKKVR